MPARKSILLPPPTAPLAVAQAFVAERVALGDCPTLLYWRGTFLSWTGTHWSMHGNDEIEALIYDFTGGALYRKPDGDTVPWNPNARHVHDVKHALKAVCRAPEELQPPCWLDERDPGPVVPCRNGLLVVEGRKVLKHTPLF